MTVHETPLTNSVVEYQLSTASVNNQELSVIWLDAHADEMSNQDSLNTISELRHVVNNIYTSVEENQCIQLLKKNRTNTTIMIVSGSLGQRVMPSIHDIHHLRTIYIYCRDKLRHEQWARNWSKIKGVFTDASSICNDLIRSIPHYDVHSVPVSFVSMNEQTTSTTNLNQLDQSFMYTQILKEILLNIDFPKKSRKEFVAYCRGQFANNERELKYINTFEEKYVKYTPIWWYTTECFLYSMLNRALRVMDVDIIIKMGFFVSDLHCQIEELHRKQYRDPSQFQSFIVYRGQGLSKIDFNKLKRNEGRLISFNSFISSSKKRNIGIIFAQRALTDPNSMGVVFKMTINSAVYPTPFALVSDFGFYGVAEQEFLFSMNTIFRIGQMNRIEDGNDERLWEVELTLTTDNDQQLNALTQHLRQETQGAKGWYQLSQFLIKIDRLGKAKELYNFLLGQTSEKNIQGYIYHQLGWIEHTLGNYTKANSFYEKGLAIDIKILDQNHPDLATTYDNMASMYDQMREYPKALLSYQKVLAIYRQTLPSNHVNIATVLNNIGFIYYKLNEYSTALLFHQEALDIYRRVHLSKHSSLATSFNYIGLVHHKLDDYSRALWYYDKALEIYVDTLPSDHIDLAFCHQNIGSTLDKMNEYSKALRSHEKALAILQKTLSTNHPHLATCYSHIASVYDNMKQYSQAISFYEKVLDIRDKTLSQNLPDLITTYNDIARVYDHMNDYVKAFSYYEKALQACSRAPTSNRLLLASSYHNIAKAYLNIGCIDKARPHAEEAITIGKRTLSANHSELQTYYTTLELIKNQL